MASVTTRRSADVLTVPEAAELLGLSRNAAYRLAKAGELPGAVRLGGAIRVSRIRLMAFLHGEAASAEAS